MDSFDSRGRGRIFLSRRFDGTTISAVAGRLHDSLVERFGPEAIFPGFPSIPIDQDFLKVIEQAVASCQLVLVLIDYEWLELRDDAGHRLIDKPDDFARVEVEAALEHNVQVMLVLIDDTRMPRPEDLPESLRRLAHHSAVEIHLRRDRFQRDVEFLIGTVEVYLESTEANRRRQSAHTPEGGYISAPPVRRLVFVSYSHTDDYWLGRLQVHLKPLARHGRIEMWDDTQIQVGDEWRSEIRKAVENCSAAVLLVSADFMASDFIDNNELPPLLEAARQHGVRILPVLVSSSYFEDSELGRFQAVNAPSRPLDMVSRGEQEAVFSKLQKAIRSVLL